MRWTGNVVREVHKGFCSGDLLERGHLANLPVDGRVILKY